jgi:hypothetical protein
LAGKGVFFNLGLIMYGFIKLYKIDLLLNNRKMDISNILNLVSDVGGKDVSAGQSLLTFLTLFPRSEERVDQRSVVGVSNRRHP